MVRYNKKEGVCLTVCTSFPPLKNFLGFPEGITMPTSSPTLTSLLLLQSKDSPLKMYHLILRESLLDINKINNITNHNYKEIQHITLKKPKQFTLTVCLRRTQIVNMSGSCDIFFIVDFCDGNIFIMTGQFLFFLTLLDL